MPEDEWYEEWTSDDFVALPELVSVAYENQHHNPRLQYLTGVARDDAAYMICRFLSAFSESKARTTLGCRLASSSAQW